MVVVVAAVVPPALVSLQPCACASTRVLAAAHAVGYGDVTASLYNPLEMAISTALMLAGSMLWAQVLATIVSVLSALDAEQNDFRKSVDALNNFMRDNNLDLQLRRRLRNGRTHLEPPSVAAATIAAIAVIAAVAAIAAAIGATAIGATAIGATAIVAAAIAAVAAAIAAAAAAAAMFQRWSPGRATWHR